jgi:hypothetical protein
VHRLLLLVSVLLLLTMACAPRVRVAHAPTPEAQLRLAALPRIWVAGFVVARPSQRKPAFDLNTETVRLLRTQLRIWSTAQVVEAEPLVLDSEQRLSDVLYWRRLGEEHGWPLIVTGSLKLLIAPPKIEQRGRRTIYVPLAGRVLDATVVLIDGRTGDILSRHKLPSRMRYGLGRLGSPLWLYFEMMDQAMPDWFKAITETAT